MSRQKGDKKRLENWRKELDRSHPTSAYVDRCGCTKGRPCRVDCVRCMTGCCPTTRRHGQEGGPPTRGEADARR